MPSRFACLPCFGLGSERPNVFALAGHEMPAHTGLVRGHAFKRPIAKLAGELVLNLRVME
jgi:hypothetical protein